MNEIDFAELSAARALGALSPDEQRNFDEALAAHPEWAAIVAADEAAAAALADTVTDVAPPAELRASLLARIQDIPQNTDADAAADAPPAPFTFVTPSVESVRSVPIANARRARRILFALAASIALVVAIGIGGTMIAGQLNPKPAAVVALEKIESAPDAASAQAGVTGGGTATLHWSSSLGQAVLVSSGMASLASDRTYELWYLRDGVPTAAGTFDVSGGSATAQLRGGFQAGDIVAVTVEQQGGSATGQPTTKPVLAIETPA